MCGRLYYVWAFVRFGKYLRFNKDFNIFDKGHSSINPLRRSDRLLYNCMYSFLDSNTP